MRVLLVGGGGREHALAWRLAASPRVERLWVAPGNPGIARHATLVPIGADRLDDLVAFVARERIDVTIVGPEAPLVAGLADRLAERGHLALGPGALAARLEGSKAFAKDLMARHGIPTADFATFSDPADVRRYCRVLGPPLVVKADGLAAGKGAIVCRTLEEADAAVAACLEQRVFGPAGDRVIVEEFLEGEELSFFALANGREAIPLGAAQDHKAALDDDRGPNTGGMGAYAPVPVVSEALAVRIMETIVRPTIAALQAEGAAYRGVLFVGLMLTREGPKVLEFNCRFGDPECQVLVARLAEDPLPALVAAARGEPLPPEIASTDAASVCVNLVSGGYPGPYRTGLSIDGLDAAEALGGVRVFHAGTALRDGKLVTAGGRVLGVTATAPALAAAVERAYDAVHQIHFDGVHYRTDIGKKGLR